MTVTDLRQWHLDQAEKANANARYWATLGDKACAPELREQLARPWLLMAAFHVAAAELLSDRLADAA